MNQSDNISELAKALCNVQKESLFALKDSNNPFFKSKYADLSSVWEVIRKPLTDNGLAIAQGMQYDSTDHGQLIITTTLMHKSGQFIKSHLAIKPDKDTPQGTGSAITYGRRYALSAMVGVCPADDDAEGAMDRRKAKTKADKKIKKEMNQDEMTAQDRNQIINKGLDYGDGITRKEVEDAVRWHAKKIKQDPNSGVVATHCLDKPGIAKIIDDFMDEKNPPEIVS